MGEILSFGSSSKFKTDLGGNMRIIIVGGIAAGMSAAAKLRRTDRDAEIVKISTYIFWSLWTTLLCWRKF